jgi:anti-sigma B factor antagonist
MILTVNTTETPEAWVVQLAGKLALGRDSEQVEKQVSALLEKDKKALILDLSGLQYIDSTGVGIVAFCFGRVSARGGAFRVAGAQGAVREVFRLTHLDQLVPFDGTAEEARARVA